MINACASEDINNDRKYFSGGKITKRFVEKQKDAAAFHGPDPFDRRVRYHLVARNVLSTRRFYRPFVVYCDTRPVLHATRPSPPTSLHKFITSTRPKFKVQTDTKPTCVLGQNFFSTCSPPRLGSLVVCCLRKIPLWRCSS